MIKNVTKVSKLKIHEWKLHVKGIDAEILVSKLPVVMEIMMKQYWGFFIRYTLYVSMDLCLQWCTELPAPGLTKWLIFNSQISMPEIRIFLTMYSIVRNSQLVQYKCRAEGDNLIPVCNIISQISWRWVTTISLLITTYLCRNDYDMFSILWNQYDCSFRRWNDSQLMTVGISE